MRTSSYDYNGADDNRETNNYDDYNQEDDDSKANDNDEADDSKDAINGWNDHDFEGGNNLRSRQEQWRKWRKQ